MAEHLVFIVVMEIRGDGIHEMHRQSFKDSRGALVMPINQKEII